VILVAVVLGAVSFGLSLVFFLCGLGFGVLAWLSLTLYTFLAPVYILERVNVFESLNRAWSLGKLYVWPILRVSLIVIVGTGAVNYVISSLVPVSEVTAQGGIGFTFNPIATFINIVVGALLAPVGAIAATIQYLDARAQYEGLDVSLARLAKHGARPADVESPPAGTFLTSKDMTNMFLMTLIVVGLFFLAFIVLGTVAPILNPRLN
jgi:hypothetical protein